MFPEEKPKCVFCEIAQEKIAAFKVYEDEKFLAFLDIRPLNPGHTLVIPKEHYRWVWDVPEISEYYNVVRKIAKAIQKAFNTEWVISLVIGEAVPHAHVWLVPRHEGDGHGATINFSAVKHLTKEEMQQAADKIRKALEHAPVV